MSTTIGEFLFALGFKPPDMKPLAKAQQAAQTAINAAQQKIADGADDAADAIRAAGARVDAVARKNAQTISGVEVALEAVGEGARSAAKKFLGAWKDPQRLTEAWSNALGRLRTGVLAIGGVAAGAAGSIAAIVTHTAEADRATANWATRLGEPIDKLSRLEAAASKVAGADGVDALREALQTLRENLGELGGEGTGPALEALRDLGIELDQIQGKDAGTQMAILADAIAETPNENGIKATLELLGGGDGGKLLPFLRQGSAGIRELGDEAEALGLVLDESAVKQSAALAGEIGQVTAMVKALVADVARGLMPTIRGYLAIGRQWLAGNRELLQQRIAEWLDKVVDGIRRLAEFAGKVIDGLSGLVDMLGGLESALMIAAVAFGALQVAALGIPGVVAAASAALALGITQLAGFREEARKLREERERAEGNVVEIDNAADALRELNRRKREGTLSALSDADYDALIETYLRGSETAGSNLDSESRLVGAFDRRRDAEQARARSDAAFASNTNLASRENVQLALGPAMRKRAKKLGLGEGAVEAGIAIAQQALREGASPDAAEKAALAKIDSIAGAPAGGAGAGRINTRQAEELFGAELRRLAAREGLSEGAVNKALEAGASSLAEFSTPDVARRAALGRLGGLAGKDFSPAKGGDPLLSQIFGSDVPDVELSALARGAQPQVLISNITNTLNLDAPITINGAGDPARVGDHAAARLKSEFQLAVSQASRTVKPVFAR